MNLFERISEAPVDPILGLAETFRADPNPGKINLTVGVYQDDAGNVPILKTVKEAEKRLLANEKTKTYLPMSGSPEYTKRVQELVFGVGNEMVTTGRVATLHTPGGTCALRVAGEFVSRVLGPRTIWMSNPTWANHKGIFETAGLKTDYYSYLDRATNSLNFAGMITVLENVPENDIVLLHACCHNPTGIDPTVDQWETIAKVCKERRLLPILDFAYQGFGHGTVEDAAAVRALSEYGMEFFVCSSFSKNFGLYRERVGALHAVAKNAVEAERAAGHLKLVIRTNYSNPPSHGGQIVAQILSDAALRHEWEEELGEMRHRIAGLRESFRAALERATGDTSGRWNFISTQTGMFSLLPLSDEQVARLRDEFSIYAVKGGRINVAGMTAANLDTVAKAIAAVIA